MSPASCIAKMAALTFVLFWPQSDPMAHAHQKSRRRSCPLGTQIPITNINTNTLLNTHKRLQVTSMVIEAIN